MIEQGDKQMKTTIKTKTKYVLKNHDTRWVLSCKTLEEAQKYAATAWEWKGKNSSITKIETVTKSTPCALA